MNLFVEILMLLALGLLAFQNGSITKQLKEARKEISEIKAAAKKEEPVEVCHDVIE